MLSKNERFAPFTEFLMLRKMSVDVSKHDFQLHDLPKDEVDRQILSFLSPENEDSGDDIDLMEHSLREEKKKPKRAQPTRNELELRNKDIIREINICMAHLQENVSIDIDRSSIIGRRNLLTLWRHLIFVVMNEKDEKGTLQPSFVTSCQPRQWFCNTILTAGIYEMEPNSGVVLISADTGGNIGTVADSFERQNIRIFPRFRLHEFKAKLTEKLYLSPGDIRTIVIPMNVNRNHWGVLIAMEQAPSHWILYWGDSLRAEISDGRLRFVIAAIEYALNTTVEWEISGKNYMLDVLLYKKQMDSYSCGAYVLSCMSSFCRTRGRIPIDTFRAKYDADLTEQYRLRAAECRLTAIIATRTRRMAFTDEYHVNEIQRMNREGCYAQRHQRVVQETLRNSKGTATVVRYEGGATIAETDNYEEILMDSEEEPDVSCKVRPERNVVGSSKALVEKSATKKSKTADDNVERSCAKHVDSAGANGKSAEKDGTVEVLRRKKGTRKMTTDNAEHIGVSQGVINATSKPTKQVLQKKVVEDLPGYFFELMKEGYSYGVHLRRHLARVGKYRFSTRVRCLQYKSYPKGSGCKAGIVAKLRSNLRQWEIQGENSHNHVRREMSSTIMNKRVASIRSSIKKSCPSTLKIPHIHFIPKRGSSANTPQPGEDSFSKRQASGKSLLNLDSNSDGDDFMARHELSQSHFTQAQALIPTAPAPPRESTETKIGVIGVEEEILDEGNGDEDLPGSGELVGMEVS
ncbi:Papain-like cysteine peptidase [Gracilaria domingensis]|nr:Papain-like cysteine peptidase [Gracilaria domingensis]